MFELKPLSKEGVPSALEKAERYRLLNEPAEAVSICHDVLRTEPDNQEALVTLLLALTDRFQKGYSIGLTEAKDVLPRLKREYDRAYYAGVICERRAKAHLQQGGLGFMAYEWLREAMEHYERAEKIRPPGNDDAILRWNTCARFIQGNPTVAPRKDEPPTLGLE